MTFPFPTFVPDAADGAPALTTLTKVAEAVSTGASVIGPAEIEAGDLIVLLDSALGKAGSPTEVIPSTFTSIVSTVLGGSNFRQVASYKIADGSEASANITGMDGDAASSKELLVFRGDAAIQSVTVSTPNAEATTGNPSPQNVAASGGTPPLVVFGCYGAVLTAIDPRTMSPAKDGEVNASTTSYLAWLIYNSAPGDVSVDMDDESGNILQSFFIEAASA